MNEDELLAAVGHFMDLERKYEEVAQMSMAIRHAGHESVAHLARADQQAFEDLYEAALEMAGMDDVPFDAVYDVRNPNPHPGEA